MHNIENLQTFLRLSEYNNIAHGINKEMGNIYAMLAAARSPSAAASAMCVRHAAMTADSGDVENAISTKSR